MTIPNHQKAAKPDKLQTAKPAGPVRAQQVPALPPVADVAAASQARVDPHALTPRKVIALQRVVGNQQVARMVAQAREQHIQAKLTVNAPGDAYEQEADRVAETVMRMAAPGSALNAAPPTISDGGRETNDERLWPNSESLIPNIRRMSTPGDGSFAADAAVESRILARQGGGSALPAETRDFMESRFGADFGHVRVHTDSEAVQLSREVQAQAFTHGSDIYFGEGKYDPSSNDGKRLLAHELTHVVQQGGGKQRVQRQGFTSTITFRERLFSRWFTVEPGKSLVASIDAKKNPEGCQMPGHFYVYLYNAATDGYETTVKYPVDKSAHYTWKGLKGGAYQFIFKFNENVAEGCNLTGTLEVKQEGAIDNIVPAARNHVGSTAWAVDADRPPYGPGTNKCNLFVYEALNEAGAAVSMIERRRFGISRGSHPPLAGQWADSGFSISGWRVVSTPQPGDVVAEAHEYSDASGHVGIVSSVTQDGKSGTTISASTSGSVVENDWGFRSGQNVVFRRYVGR